MKRLLNKIYFSAELLSSNQFIAEKQNLIKFLISDSISNTEIQEVQIRLTSKDRAGSIITTYFDWTILTKDTNIADVYYTTLTPSFTLDTDNESFLDILIKDIDNNEFLITNSVLSPKVLV